MNESEIKSLFPAYKVIKETKTHTTIKPTPKSHTLLVFVKKPFSIITPREKTPLLIQTNGLKHIFFRNGHIVAVSHGELKYFARYAPRKRSAKRQIEKDAITLSVKLRNPHITSNQKIWLLRNLLAMATDTSPDKLAKRWIAYGIDKGFWNDFIERDNTLPPIDPLLYADASNLEYLLSLTLTRLLSFRVRGFKTLKKHLTENCANINTGISALNIYTTPEIAYTALLLISLKNINTSVHVPYTPQHIPIVNIPSSIRVIPQPLPIAPVDIPIVANFRTKTSFWKSKDGKNILKTILSGKTPYIIMLTSKSMLTKLQGTFKRMGFSIEPINTTMGIYKAVREP